MVVRLRLWNLADSKTTLAELREKLPAPCGGQTWISDEATERFGLIAFGELPGELDRVRERQPFELCVDVYGRPEAAKIGAGVELSGRFAAGRGTEPASYRSASGTVVRTPDWAVLVPPLDG